MTVDGEVYGGCGNVENGNFTLTVHGEQTAVVEAIKDGALVRAGSKFIKAVYLVPALKNEERERCLPCGGCRQTVAEFAAVDGVWLIENPYGYVDTYRFDEFLPWPYPAYSAGSTCLRSPLLFLRSLLRSVEKKVNEIEAQMRVLKEKQHELEKCALSIKNDGPKE